jgi:hypothetical protein
VLGGPSLAPPFAHPVEEQLQKELRALESKYRATISTGFGFDSRYLFKLVHAGDFSGRVVGIADGDTINVLHDRFPLIARVSFPMPLIA